MPKGIWCEKERPSRRRTGKRLASAAWQSFFPSAIRMEAILLGTGLDLAAAIKAAHLEAAQLQELIAEAKDARNLMPL